MSTKTAIVIGSGFGGRRKVRLYWRQSICCLSRRLAKHSASAASGKTVFARLSMSVPGSFPNATTVSSLPSEGMVLRLIQFRYRCVYWTVQFQD